MAFLGERSQALRLMVPGGRAAGLACLAGATAVWMSYMARAVPIRVHTLPVQLAPRMTMTAVTALVLMLAVDAVILIAVLRRQPRGSVDPAGKRPHSKGSPASLRPHPAGLRTSCIAALAAPTAALGSVL